MAFTLKGEYERLKKFEKESFGHLAFECRVAAGHVTRIEYVSKVACSEEDKICVYVIAGWEKEERLGLVLTQKDVEKRYQDRTYRLYRTKSGNLLKKYSKD